MLGLAAGSRLPAPVSLWLALLAGHGFVAASPLPAAWEGALRGAALALASVSLASSWAAARYRARVSGLLWLRRAEAACGVAALLAAGGSLGGEADRAARLLPVHPRAMPCEIEARVLDSVPADAAHPTLTVAVRSVGVGTARADCRAALLLRWGEDGAPPAWATPGLWIRFRGVYRPPEGARNPGVAAPGRWLERLRLAGTVEVDPSTVSIIADPGASGLLWSGLARHRLARLYSEALSPPVAALARGMALGDRSGIAPAVRDAFRDGGTIHILSISGLHVCVLAGIVARIAVALRLPAIPAACAELIALWGYVFLVGAPASASRSAILWTAMRAGTVRGTAVRPFAAWGLAGMLLELADPAVLEDPGFQLSFAAVLGLLASGGLGLPRERAPERRAPLALAGRASAGVLALAQQSAFAEAGTLAIQVRLFGAVPIAGLLLNLAVIPLCGAFMAGLLLHLGCAFLAPPLESAAAGTVEVLGLLMLAITRWTAALIPPIAARGVPSGAGVVLPLAALLIAAAAAERIRADGNERRRRSRLLVAGAALLVAWAAPVLLLERHSTPPASVLVLDVGQGDAALARAGGAAVLVDFGSSTGSRDEGRFAVEPALRAEGITEVDVAVLSHAHRDHYGGLSWLARRGFVRTVLENGSDPAGAWRGPIERAFQAGGRFVPVRADTFLAWGDLDVRILPPDAALAGATRSRNAQENNRSLAAMLRIGKHTVCFAGDVEHEAESLLVGRMGPAAVLKVPHHGSKTSSDAAWLDAVRPRLALVSCGEGNRFGHPDPATMGRYARRGTRVFRTDREGAIRVTLLARGALVSTRAHPEPELVAWEEGRP